MEKDDSSLPDKIISIIRQNLEKFNDQRKELGRQLYNIEDMKSSHLPEKYILQSLVRENTLLLKILRKLNKEDVVNEIFDKLQGS